ncbi:MAG: hypothetical protein JXB39_12450 [Deltaproteobacteria bacterium]|nr:hypothetical protein [Deltaproteobacteria bacterium]
MRSSRGARTAGALALVLGPAVGMGAARATATAWRSAGCLLLAEPLVTGLLLYGVLALATGRRWRWAGLLALGVLLAVATVHVSLPTPWARDATEVLGDPVLPWADEVAPCAHPEVPPRGTVRVVTWDVPEIGLGSRALAALADLRPDVVVLTHLADSGFLETFTAAMPGESFSAGPVGRRIGVWIRGTFQPCGGEAAAWPHVISGPAAGDLLVVSLPAVEGVGVFPLATFQASRGSAWPGVVREMTAALVAVTAFGGETLVAAGHLSAPASFSAPTRMLGTVGLRDLGGPPTWPDRVRNLPFLTVHRMDRVYTGRAWKAHQTLTQSVAGPSRILLVQIGQEPRFLESR